MTMRIVFSDLDGTFLDSRKQVSDHNRQALDELARRGIPFVPCSGRPLGGIAPELLEHPATRYVVSANGATVSELDPTDHRTDTARTIHQTPLDRSYACAVWELARGRDVTFDIFADGQCYLRRDLFDRIGEFADDPYIAESMRNTRTPVDEEPEATIARVQVLERVSIYWKDPRDRDEILAALRTMSGIDITRSYPMNIEVMDAHASKGAALAWLCAHLGIDVADSVAFGDNINDIPLLQAAGTGVAMANAEDETKAAANELCASNDESGVGAWLLTH